MALIDVIVPVYKVEAYLEKCVNSLLHQDFEDFRIVLVNDGSPDRCPQICEQFKSEYPEKIDVIHKQNGGLSDARNAGTSISNAEFIVYVDSDDYVEPQFLSHLIQEQKRVNADIVISNAIKEFIDSDGNIVRTVVFESEPIVLNNEEALIELCYERTFRGYAWAKLYRTDIAKKHLYPKGRLFEDVFTVYKELYESSVISAIGCCDYHYVQRPNSIMNCSFEEKHLDLNIGVSQMANFLKERIESKKLQQAVSYRIVEACHISLWRSIHSNEFKEYYKRLIPSARKELKSVLQNPRTGRERKAVYLLMAYLPWLYRIVLRRRNCAGHTA